MKTLNRRTRITLGVVAAMACFLIAGCYTQIKTEALRSEPVGETPLAQVRTDDLIVTTDHPWYEKSEEDRDVMITARFENNGYVPVALTGCPSPPSVVVEEWDGNVWRDGLTIGRICRSIYGFETLEFGPGEWLEFEINLKYPGWYRLRLLVGPDKDHPTDAVHSNQFLIR